MLDFYEKRKLKGVLSSRPVLVLMLLPIGFLSYTAWNAYLMEVDATERRMELTAELTALEWRTESLTEEITQLEDPHGVETALRQRFELSKEGEEVIVFIEDEEDVREESVRVEEERGFLERLKGLFGGE